MARCRCENKRHPEHTGCDCAATAAESDGYCKACFDHAASESARTNSSEAGTAQVGDTKFIQSGTARFDLAPYGFYKWGQEFAHADSAFDSRKFSIVPYFLNCQAIELALKAFLLSKGYSKSQVKKYGHNLMVLHTQARQSGLGQFVTLTGGDLKVLQTATRLYDVGQKGKQFQYFDPELAMRGYRNLPNLEALRSITKRLLTNNQLEQQYLNG